jgi:CrcB protein
MWHDRTAALLAVALGGALGSVTRYGLGLAWPEPPGTGFPWTTFTINVTGSLAIGVLVAVLGATPHPLLRPLLGTGVLGGFTTFSTYAEQVRALVAAGRVGIAAAYVLGTVAAAIGAASVGLLVAGRRRLV